MLFWQGFVLRAHTKYWLEKLIYSIRYTVLVCTLHRHFYIWLFYHTVCWDITFLIWERIHFICSFRRGSYVTKWPDELKTMKIQQIFFCIELRFPFDWRTPSGYLMAWFAQCAGALTGGSIYTQFPNLVFGTCWLFIFIAEDITMEVDAFNVDVKRSLGRNRAKLTKRFCDMVQLYWDAKQWVQEKFIIALVITLPFSSRVMELNQINRYSLFVCFMWNMLAISSKIDHFLNLI